MMDKAKLERLRYLAKNLGLTVCKLRKQNAFILTRNGENIPVVPQILQAAELEKVLADFAATTSV